MARLTKTEGSALLHYNFHFFISIFYSNLQTLQNNQQHQTHANPMPSNAPMPQQQPIQQVHVPAHVYYHRYVIIQGVSILIVFFPNGSELKERMIFFILRHLY